MEILKSTGIALSSQVYGESDIACNFYTSDFGKRKFVFKGLKKSGKRSRAATEPGAVASIIYYYRDDRDSFIVNQCDIEKYYSSITENLEKIFFYISCSNRLKRRAVTIVPILRYTRCFRASTPLEDGSPGALIPFSSASSPEPRVLPDVDSCKSCGVQDFQQFLLDTIDLRPVCIPCARRHSTDSVRRLPALPGRMRDCIVLFLDRKFASIDLDDYTEDEVLDVLFNLSLFVEDYFHAELKTKSFIFSGRFK